MDFDGVEAEFPQRPLETDLICGDREFCLLQRSCDFGRSDTTVEMSFVVRIGYDRNALLRDRICQLAEICQPRFFDRLQPSLVLFHHAAMVVGGQSGEPLWEQVILGKARFDLDDFALLSQVIHRLDQHQLDTPVGTLGKTLEAT